MKKLLTTVITAVATCTAMADPADDVRCREIGFSLAAEARDAGAFRSHIDADARFLGDGVLRGADEIVEGWRPFLEEGGPAIKWRPRFVEVLESGNLALTRGPYRVLTTSESGESVERWGTFNSVWRLHEDGEWRVVFDAGSPGSGTPSAADRELLAAPDECPRRGDPEAGRN